MALLAVLLPVFMLGVILALGAYEDVLLPPPVAGPERQPTPLEPLDAMSGLDAIPGQGRKV
ncbi:hypothetical protein OG897_16530 [Streptomyces sp. NBC_00237]|uniref:hypothetical protein n=1 Tax=Streptomyces sp. NBC_00237 TaxID=2975687 RepID=UPI00225B0372|nr:hypothetical protein [Streptomyces sp. NBC_00237]MCX5203049.1 hypothetical protein [Streptomyces sp. NBC_00237]